MEVLKSLKYGDERNPLRITKLDDGAISICPPFPGRRSRGPAVWISYIPAPVWMEILGFLDSDTEESERFIYDEKAHKAMEDERRRNSA